MAKYIDADKVHIDYDKLRTCGNYIDAGQYLISVINEAPTADVVEVRHGKWLPHKSKYGNDNESVYTCSECGDNIGFQKKTYCPNCGAKMDKENE